MACNDEWCDLCEDKLKATTVITPSGREIDICGHCASMCDYPAVEEAVDDGTTQESAA